jgi:DNA-binding CsgD family transcriptional regulator
LLAELQNCSGASALLARLTRAQTNVLRLLADGLSTNEIAERLGISGETVKTHVKNILSQFGVHSRAKAVSLASQIWMQ